MSTDYRGYPDFAFSSTAMNQLLQTMVDMVDTDVNTLSGTITTNSDHGNLSGLADDDHTQYLNTTRGDARYYTETELDSLLATQSGTLSNEIDSDITTHEAGDNHTIYTKVDGSRMFTDSVGGWFDDGTNFRVTVSGGIITNIGATISGGYSMS